MTLGEIKGDRVNKLYDVLLSTKSFQINTNDPFTFASGIKSPIYCDTRRLISYPKERKIILFGFLEKISNMGIECILGVATGGYHGGHGFLIGSISLLDMLDPLVRAIGKNRASKEILMLGIIFSLLKTLFQLVVQLKAINLLKESSANSLNALSIFSYQFPESVEMFQKLNVPFQSLLTLEGLLEHASDSLGDTKGEIELWRKNPWEWKRHE